MMRVELGDRVVRKEHRWLSPVLKVAPHIFYFMGFGLD